MRKPAPLPSTLFKVGVGVGEMLSLSFGTNALVQLRVRVPAARSGL